MSHRKRLILAIVVLGLTVIPGRLAAQGGAFEAVSNPFMDEFEFALGADLTPNVEIDDVRWRLLRMDLDDDPPVDGEESRVEFTIELENLNERSKKFNLIVLLEDERGGQLERVELDTVRASSGRLESDRQRVRVQGRSLLRLAKVYVLAEVE